MKTAKRYFKNRELSEKEILLYQAVNGLLERGESLSELRVADIAKEAGIGKGTVYEYVTSKEELLANSFLYQVWREVEQLQEQVSRCATFRELCRGIFDLVHRKAVSGTNIMSIAGAGELSPSLVTMMESVKEDFNLAAQKLFSLLDQILEQGVREGEINPASSPEYQHFVITGVCTSLVSRQCSGAAKDWETEQRLAYQMLVAAFQ